jgi:hypothetical protein
MNESPTPDQILRDIEFEIVQGALGQDDLGQALQAAKRFLNQSQQELLRSDARGHGLELATHQFQINEMLLVLIQEMAARLRRLQVDLQRTAGLVPGSAPGIRPREVEPTPWWTGDVGAGNALDGGLDPANYLVELAKIDRKLKVESHMRPIRLPLVGPLLTRLRAALHNLPMFYVDQLASQQMEVNHALGDSLDQLSHLLAEQQAQIQALRQEVQALQDRSAPDRPSDRG